MAVPDEMTWRRSQKNETGSAEFIDQITINPDRQQRYDFQFMYDGEEKIARKILIKVKYKDSTRKEEVNTILHPQ